LAGRGFDEVYNLKGGIKAWQGLKAIGPAEVGMVSVTGSETAAEIVMLAFGQEEGLRSFYAAMALETTDHEVADLFLKLANIEDGHKERLFSLHKTLDPSASADRSVFEATVADKAMEGGLTGEEFLEQNRPAMQTAEDVLSMAMMIETQALDLYLRYMGKSGREEAKKVLAEIAEEEKSHLKELGRLMDNVVQ